MDVWFCARGAWLWCSRCFPFPDAVIKAPLDSPLRPVATDFSFYQDTVPFICIFLKYWVILILSVFLYFPFMLTDIWLFSFLKNCNFYSIYLMEKLIGFCLCSNLKIAVICAHRDCIANVCALILSFWMLLLVAFHVFKYGEILLNDVFVTEFVLEVLFLPICQNASSLTLFREGWKLFLAPLQPYFYVLCWFNVFICFVTTQFLLYLFSSILICSFSLKKYLDS